jgi:hypothetical protein
MHNIGHKAWVLMVRHCNNHALAGRAMLNAKMFQYKPGGAQELRAKRVALSLHAQSNLQYDMHKLGHKACVFMAAIREGLEKAMF